MGGSTSGHYAQDDTMLFESRQLLLWLEQISHLDFNRCSQCLQRPCVMCLPSGSV